MSRRAASIAPRLLDPILDLIERIDRARRLISPAGPHAVLGVERHRHRGAAVTLADGTRVERGARAWIIHFDNGRIRGLARGTWQTAAWGAA